MASQNDAIRTLVKRPTVEVDADATLRQVAVTLADDYIGVAVVRGLRPRGAPGSRADGLVSERDIVRALADGANPDTEVARNIMTADLATAAPSDSIMQVAQCMLDNEIRHVPVASDNGAVVGIVSERDALRALVTPDQAAPPGSIEGQRAQLQS
jgi:CBS domain-containing protein